MAELRLLPYSPDCRHEWDDFVMRSKNATFLHRRDYLEYHADRFHDSSLMVFRNNKLYALLPATFDGETFSSHAGLTYGGLLLDKKATTAEVLEIMLMIRDHARILGASRFIYKPVPHIYHRYPAEEDLYALFRLYATLSARNVSTVIDTQNPIKLRFIRKAGIRKALATGIAIEESDDYPAFWKILDDNLMDRYGAHPVHSLEEIMRLKEFFPDNIRLHIARLGNTILGGSVIYITDTTAHTQYISATPEGKDLHALDLLFSTLISRDYNHLPYFDFGTSNEEGGRVLNESLIYQKEGFGGRAIVYDTCSIPLK